MTDTAKRLFIFDVDGTLLDTSSGILAAVSHTIEIFGKEMPDAESLRRFIGPPIEVGFSTYCKADDPTTAEMAKCFRRAYAQDFLLMARPYEGLIDTLDKILERGDEIAVATYKRQSYLDPLMKAFGFDRYTDTIFGSDAEGRLTKADIINMCIDHHPEIARDNIYMIGDTEQDQNAALALGIKFIGVTWGFGFKSRSEIKGVGCDTMTDLYAIISQE